MAKKRHKRFEKDPSPKPQVQPRKIESNALKIERAQPSFWTRSRVLVAMGLSATMGIGGYIVHRESRPDKPHSAESVQENINEITLGNVRFQLQDSENFPPHEKQELFSNMQKAYETLTAYLSEDVMNMTTPINFPIILKNKKGKDEPDGQVTWNINALLEKDGPKIVGEVTPQALTLWRRTESVIAHEFVHLFAQAPGFWSQAFYEGHGHAIQDILYGLKTGQGEVNEFLTTTGVDELFNIGFDYNNYDQTLKGGIRNLGLDNVVRRKWANEWKNFEKENPDFFKNFYQEVAKQKKEGKKSFSKKELFTIAEYICPTFKKWFADNKSMKEIGETEATETVKVIYIPERNEYVVLNFKPVARSFNGDQMAPPFLTPALSGTTFLTFQNKSTDQKQRFELPDKDAIFTIVEMQAMDRESSLEKVTIGNTDIPVKP